MKVKSFSRVRLLATPWTTAYQAPPSMEVSRQEYWSGVPSPPLFFAGICRQLESGFDKMLPIHLHYRLTKSRELVCCYFTLQTTIIKLTRKTKYKIKPTSFEVKLEFLHWFSVYLQGDLGQLRQCLPALIFSHMLGRSYSIYFSCLFNCLHEIPSSKFLHTSSLWQLLNKMPLLSCFSQLSI